MPAGRRAQSSLTVEYAVDLPPDVLAASPDLLASVERQLTAATDDPGALVTLGSKLETSLDSAGITAPVTVSGVSGVSGVTAEVEVVTAASSASTSSALASSAERGGGGYWASLLGLCCCCLLCGGGGYVFATNDKAAPYREKMKEKSAPHLEKLKTLKGEMMKKKTEETAVQNVEEGETEKTEPKSDGNEARPATTTPKDEEPAAKEAGTTNPAEEPPAVP
jgi:hypothetical protein